MLYRINQIVPRRKTLLKFEHSIFKIPDVLLLHVGPIIYFSYIIIAFRAFNYLILIPDFLLKWVAV